MSDGSALRLAGVTKVYDRTAAVDDVSFELEPGELLTLLGPSGSGKSTTLAMIAGFEDPTRGEILLADRSIVGVPPSRRNFGVVFQHYALFPHLTVLQNVAFGLRMRRVNRVDRDRRAREMLARVGLAALADRRPRQLSGGQQQRVALARALVFEPDALLLDEPLGALDKGLRQSLQLAIKDIQARFGVSILFVTHDQDEAMFMSDRLAVMRDGRIEQIGRPPELYLHPGSRFVATFLGETNLIRCGVVKSDHRHAVVVLPDGARAAARQPDVDPLPAGASGLLSIRPERLATLAPGDLRDVELDAVLVGRVFLGPVERVTVEALGQRLVLFQTGGRRDVLPAPGSRLRIGWTRDDAQLLSAGLDTDRAAEECLAASPA